MNICVTSNGQTCNIVPQQSLRVKQDIMIMVLKIM